MSEKLLQTVRDYIYYNELQKTKEDFVICPHSNIKISNESLRKNLDKIHLFLTSKKNQTKGSIICTLIENSLSSIQLMLGIMYSGMIQVPLNLIAGEEQLSYVVNHSGAQILFVSSKYIDLAQKIIANVSRNIEIIEIWKIDQDDPALLMYTSGTTGKPKGVMLSHKNILAGGKNVALSHKLKTNDRALCVLPLYHINGAVVTVLGPLVSQSSLILCERFSVTNFWKFISTFNCTWFSIVPTIISSLLNKFSAEEINSLNLSHVRFGRSASAALAPETHRQFEEKFKITMIETMGLTETCAPILSNPLPPGKIKYGSPGIPYGNKVKIVDSELQDVPRNTVGQICVKGANVMKEYYKNPEETKKSFIEDWFLTGDLAIMDSEDYVFVRGRIKELIIKGGENISPREIDDVLYQYPDVIEAAAFAMPCSHYGEKIEAGVVVKNKMSLKSEDLILHCRKYLGDFKTPSKIHFLDELPKGPSGKIQRFKIKDLI